MEAGTQCTGFFESSSSRIKYIRSYYKKYPDEKCEDIFSSYEADRIEDCFEFLKEINGHNASHFLRKYRLESEIETEKENDADEESARAGAGDCGGEDVWRLATVAVQRGLTRLGFEPGRVDGVLGLKTRAAIRAFQAAAGLPVDGLLSKRLADAVAAATP